MAHASFDKESIKQSIIGKIQRYNGRTLADATPQQIYYAVASTIRDQIMEKWVAARERDKTYMGKRLYYLSVEFLTGRSMHCNAVNLCTMKNVRDAPNGPILVHVVTQKGKGYAPAEAATDKYHGVVKFDVERDTAATVSAFVFFAPATIVR